MHYYSRGPPLWPLLSPPFSFSSLHSTSLTLSDANTSSNSDWNPLSFRCPPRRTAIDAMRKSRAISRAHFVCRSVRPSVERSVGGIDGCHRASFLCRFGQRTRQKRRSQERERGYGNNQSDVAIYYIGRKHRLARCTTKYDYRKPNLTDKRLNVITMPGQKKTHNTFVSNVR